MNIFKKWNWKLLFCIVLFSLSILLFLCVVIIKPEKKIIKNLYNTSKSFNKEIVEFPVKQHFILDDNSNLITLYFQDDSINKYDYNVRLVDNEGKEYFNHYYSNYSSNIILISSQDLFLAGEYDLILECQKCDNVSMLFVDSSNNSDKVLKATYTTFSRNYSYFWYSIMGIIITFTLYPLVGDENNEKK